MSEQKSATPSLKEVTGVATNATPIPRFYDIIEGLPVGKPKAMITFSLCSDGIYMTKSVMGDGYVTIKVDGIPGLPKGKETVNVLKRKIPFSIFWAIVGFFRYVESHFKKDGLEAYVLLGFDPKEDKFFLWCPIQEVGAASVRYDPAPFFVQHPGCRIIMDIHSHTSRMGAFWSGTDNNDDNRDYFSMVIGKISKMIPEFKLRFNTTGKHIDYELEDIFDDVSEPLDFDFAEACTKISLHTYVAAKGETHYAKGHFGFGGKQRRENKQRAGSDLPPWEKDHNFQEGTLVPVFSQGFVPVRKVGGQSFYDILKAGSAKQDFTIQELMGEGW